MTSCIAIDVNSFPAYCTKTHNLVKEAHQKKGMKVLFILRLPDDEDIKEQPCIRRLISHLELNIQPDQLADFHASDIQKMPELLSIHGVSVEELLVVCDDNFRATVIEFGYRPASHPLSLKALLNNKGRRVSFWDEPYYGLGCTLAHDDGFVTDADLDDDIGLAVEYASADDHPPCLPEICRVQ